MATSVAEIFKEAVELAESDRAALAGLLLESIEPIADVNLEAAWAAEVESRLRQLDAGDVKSVPWEEVRARLWAHFRDG